MAATTEIIPCSGEGCVLASHCRSFDDFENGRDGDRYMDPPERSGGDCEFFQISETAVASLRE